MKILRNFFVLEGLDGSGTTTQLQRLQQTPPMQGLQTTFEPTDGVVGRMIRQALRKEITLPSSTLAYLFAADRDSHLSDLRKQCGKGPVVCDRYITSSLAYQSLTEDWDWILQLNQRFERPEALFFLDVAPEICAQRRALRGGKSELFEDTELQIRIYQNYQRALEGMEADGVKVYRIPGLGTPEEVHQNLVEALRNAQKLPMI